MNPLILGLWIVTIAWDLPTTNDDGSSLNDLAGFNIYSAQTAFFDTGIVLEQTVGVTNSITFTMDVDSGWFAVTAFNPSGDESELSNIATWDPPHPSPPTLVRIVPN